MSKAVKKRLVRKPKRTRKQWVAIIRADHKATVKDIIKLGKDLKAAKDDLPYGEFLAMIKTDLPFGARMAQMLMGIAADRRLSEANHGTLLPASKRTLYELTKLSDQQFADATASHTIHPQMTRRDVTAIAAPIKRTTTPTMHMTAPVRRIEAPPTRTIAATPNSRLEARLCQIEQLIGELDGMEQGGDAAFIARIRAAAAQLGVVADRIEEARGNVVDLPIVLN